MCPVKTGPSKESRDLSFSTFLESSAEQTPVFHEAPSQQQFRNLLLVKHTQTDSGLRQGQQIAMPTSELCLQIWGYFRWAAGIQAEDHEVWCKWTISTEGLERRPETSSVSWGPVSAQVVLTNETAWDTPVVSPACCPGKEKAASRSCFPQSLLGQAGEIVPMRLLNPWLLSLPGSFFCLWGTFSVVWCYHRTNPS